MTMIPLVCQGLSLSSGTAHCITYPKHWPVLLILNIIAGKMGGVMLVVITLLVNLTVATGTVNGFIFYANIVPAKRSTFLPFSKPSFTSVFISLLNTKLGLGGTN